MMDQKEFDLWADGYEESVVSSDEENSYPFAGYKEILNGIYKEVRKKKEPCVLDIGIGTGTLAAKLYEHGCRIFGMDFSENMLAIAQAKLPEAKLVQGDFLEGVPEALKGQRYDFILATYSLHHLPDQEKNSFLCSVLPLLKEDGKLFIGDVAFYSRKDLEECRAACGEEWDDEEFYFVYEELAPAFGYKVSFEQYSFCAGILTFERKGDREDDGKTVPGAL